MRRYNPNSMRHVSRDIQIRDRTIYRFEWYRINNQQYIPIILDMNILEKRQEFLYLLMRGLNVKSTNYKLFTCRWWIMGGKWGSAETRWICPMGRGILWRMRVQNHHMRIGCPWGCRRITPHKASPFPLLMLPSFCHILAWSVQYIV